MSRVHFDDFDDFAAAKVVSCYACGNLVYCGDVDGDWLCDACRDDENIQPDDEFLAECERCHKAWLCSIDSPDCPSCGPRDEWFDHVGHELDEWEGPRHRCEGMRRHVLSSPGGIYPRIDSCGYTTDNSRGWSRRRRKARQRARKTWCQHWGRHLTRSRFAPIEAVPPDARMGWEFAPDTYHPERVDGGLSPRTWLRDVWQKLGVGSWDVEGDEHAAFEERISDLDDRGAFAAKMAWLHEVVGSPSTCKRGLYEHEHPSAWEYGMTNYERFVIAARELLGGGDRDEVQRRVRWEYGVGDYAIDGWLENGMRVEAALSAASMSALCSLGRLARALDILEDALGILEAVPSHHTKGAS